MQQHHDASCCERALSSRHPPHLRQKTIGVPPNTLDLPSRSDAGEHAGGGVPVTLLFHAVPTYPKPIAVQIA